MLEEHLEKASALVVLLDRVVDARDVRVDAVPYDGSAIGVQDHIAVSV